MSASGEAGRRQRRHRRLAQRRQRRGASSGEAGAGNTSGAQARPVAGAPAPARVAAARATKLAQPAAAQAVAARAECLRCPIERRAERSRPSAAVARIPCRPARPSEVHDSNLWHKSAQRCGLRDRPVELRARLYVWLPPSYDHKKAYPVVLQGPGCGGNCTRSIHCLRRRQRRRGREWDCDSVGLTPPPNAIGHATNPNQGLLRRQGKATTPLSGLLER